jgi:hypothetical protein
MEIAGAGHLLPFEAAKEVGAAIRSFVANRAAASGSG